MLSLPGNARILIYRDAVNMQNSFEGLSCMIEQAFAENLTSGTFFVFLNRRKDRMKVLCWDGDGLAIWYKRLEKGTFSRRKNDQFLMSRREFLMLLEGVIPERVQCRYNMS